MFAADGSCPTAAAAAGSLARRARSVRVLSGERDGLGVLRHEVLDRLTVNHGLGHREVVDDRVHARDHQGEEDEGDPDREAQDPPPEGQPRGDEGGILRFDALGVAGDPRGEHERDADGDRRRFDGQRVVARVGMGGIADEDDRSSRSVMTAPTSMNGFRTLSASESSPTTMRPMMSAVQNHVLSPLAWVTVKFVPLAFWKITG